MAATIKRLYGPAQPGTTNATLYTNASGAGGIVKSIALANTTALAATINIAINGTSATAANCILFQVSVPASDSVFISNLFIPVANTDTIQGLQGTTSAITVTIGGVDGV